MKTLFSKLAVLFAMLFLSFGAFAVPPDFSSITGAVDFSTVGTGILAVAALLAAVLVIRKGAKLVLGAIK